ncbi:hypothetical protein [Bacillus cereus]|uniref:Uncharacterized protein n=1 Tax=Bacillus cereus (strain VD014) TaxID=1053223 RepID=A0A9W5K4Q2_BACC8|nr:hypothetical protein [Bacillus cereus]EJR18255.1 hypothetical protein IIA_04208 [Bacillus cereus VD014]MBJ8150542.1 hypothetical protein [Bacillus cereus]HDR8152874.1 hypothetical protein [Bacillus cereus]
MNTTQQMQSFLNSSVGRRMMIMATKEQEAYTKKLNALKGELTELKSMYQWQMYGEDQETESLVMLDGHPVIVETDGASRVKNVKDLTPQVYAKLDALDRNNLKQAMPVLAGRLEANDMPQVSKSDRYYELKNTSVGQRIEMFRELAEWQETNDPQASENYSSPEQRTKGITKTAEHLMKQFSAEGLREMNANILSLENQIKRSEETEEIAPYVSVISGAAPEGGAEG